MSYLSYKRAIPTDDVLRQGGTSAAFIDMAVYGEREAYQYGGDAAETSRFLEPTKKCAWFAQMPVTLRKDATPEFGKSFSAVVDHTTDNLMYAWLRVVTPAVRLLPTNRYGANGRIAWTKNLAHNLVENCRLSFGGCAIEHFDSHFLDFWFEFTVPASKRAAYDRMIGNVSQLVIPKSDELESVVLDLPLPFFFSRDQRLALPLSALPYDKVSIDFDLRDWSELLVLSNAAAEPGENPYAKPIVGEDIESEPALQTVDVFVNMAVTTEHERRLAQKPRDFVIEQVQTVRPIREFDPTTNPRPKVDLKFSRSVKTIMFGVRNCTHDNVRSNYTSFSPAPGSGDDERDESANPLSGTELKYGDYVRLSSELGSDYFSTVNPWYTAPSVPERIGYNVYSFATDLYSTQPSGSTNLADICDAVLLPSASRSAIEASEGKSARPGGDYPQKYEFVVMATNSAVLKISEGRISWPTFL